eukprot:TRINITY_DN10035_c0_g1_i1.p1 TRINITY_DN10035_c0_g1~~TRINITY_DN10035_c0_g1_i1.p1  ORF type:complete len:796 (+),score=301.06 TRINITY_DN10035_c0_g1_i1:91-2388(+)
MGDDLEEKRKLKEIFALIDSDGGGSISASEVRRFVSSFPDPPSDVKIHQMIADIDSDGSNEIDDEEFCGLALSLQKICGLSISKMIEHFTRQCYNELFVSIEGGDGTGEIEGKDVRQLLEAVQTGHSMEDIRRVLKKYDDDESGKISAGEFGGIISEVSQGVPISVFIHKFEEAQRKRAERMRRLKGAFEEKIEKAGGSPDQPPVPRARKRSAAAPAPAPAPAGEPAACAQCAALREQLERAQSEAAAAQEAAREAASAAEARAAEAAESAAAAERAAAEVNEEKGRAQGLERDVSDLQKRLKEAKRSSMQPGARQALRAAEEEAEALRAKLQKAEQRGRTLEKELGEARAQLRASMRTSARSDPQQQPAGASPDELAELGQQLWTLQTACAIRAREIDRLQRLVKEFVARVGGGDPALGEELRQQAARCVQLSRDEAVAAFGGDLATAVAAAESALKDHAALGVIPAWEAPAAPTAGSGQSRRSSAASATQGLLERLRAAEQAEQEAAARAAAAQQENERLAQRLREATARPTPSRPASTASSDAPRRPGPDASSGRAPPHTPTGAAVSPPSAPRPLPAPSRETAAEVAELRAAAAQGRLRITELEAQLQRAHAAIISSAGAGWHSERKLNQARDVVQALIAQTAAGAPPTELQRSGAPNRGPPTPPPVDTEVFIPNARDSKPPALLAALRSQPLLYPPQPSRPAASAAAAHPGNLGETLRGALLGALRRQGGRDSQSPPRDVLTPMRSTHSGGALCSPQRPSG